MLTGISKPFAILLPLRNEFANTHIEACPADGSGSKAADLGYFELKTACSHASSWSSTAEPQLIYRRSLRQYSAFSAPSYRPGFRRKYLGSTSFDRRFRIWLIRTGCRAAHRTLRVFRRSGGGRCGSGTIVNSNPTTSETITENYQRKLFPKGDTFFVADLAIITVRSRLEQVVRSQ